MLTIIIGAKYTVGSQWILAKLYFIIFNKLYLIDWYRFLDALFYMQVKNKKQGFF